MPVDCMTGMLGFYCSYVVLTYSQSAGAFCKQMEGAAWKRLGATWIALRKLRSIQATLATLAGPVFPIFRCNNTL